MTVTREQIITATKCVLGAQAAETGARIADQLGLTHPVLAPAQDELLDFGMWVDDPPRVALKPEYAARLNALPLSHVAVMVESFEGDLDLSWTAAQLRALAAASPHLQIVITLCPAPTREYMTQLAAKLPALIDASGAVAVDCDLEMPWKRHLVQGFPSLKAAGAELVRVIHASAALVGRTVEIEVDTFPAHLEARAGGAVVGEDRLWVQTYAVAEARGEVRDFDGPLGPARRPYEDLLRVRRDGEPGVELCAGLAAWEQADWPGEPVESMRLALDSARRAGVKRVRWFSSKHAIGVRANRYAAAAIETFRPLARVTGM